MEWENDQASDRASTTRSFVRWLWLRIVSRGPSSMPILTMIGLLHDAGWLGDLGMVRSLPIL